MNLETHIKSNRHSLRKRVSKGKTQKKSNSYVDPKNFRFAADVEYTAKRGLDLFLGALIFIAFAIFLPIIALGIKRSSKGPVLEKQPHTGKHGHIFLCYKFRTTHTTGNTSLNRQINKSVNPLHFSFGEFLESSSLKHLPSILNVLQGEMSLVGPKSYVVAECEYWNSVFDDHFYRYFLKPGIFSPALAFDTQEGKSKKYKVRKRLDVELSYINKNSLLIDFKVILKSIKQNLLGK